MAREIVWTKRANQKFSRIIDYLEKEWGLKVTQNLIRRTFDILHLPSDQPELGTIENGARNIRGFLITKHNRLFNRVTDLEIIELNLFDTRSGSGQSKL